MNETQTVQPETLVVIRDGKLDQDYYQQVYNQKRREALADVRTELIKDLCSVPAKAGRAVVYLFAHIADQAN